VCEPCTNMLAARASCFDSVTSPTAMFSPIRCRRGYSARVNTRVRIAAYYRLFLQASCSICRTPHLKSVGHLIFPFFEDYLKTPKGLTRFDSKLPGCTETLACICRKRLPASDHTADPVSPIRTTSARTPAHDRGHARKSREHTQSAACRSAYFLPVCRPPLSRDAGRSLTRGGGSDETHCAASN
jgi:hypothetical protein